MYVVFHRCHGISHYPKHMLTWHNEVPLERGQFSQKHKKDTP